MYKLSVKQWNPFVGCLNQCTYCGSSFQAQLKRWAKQHCEKCYQFKPHLHPERLEQPLPRTGFMQFIFTCSNGDIAYCPTHYLEAIIKRIKREPDKTFLIQSKNPKTFNRVKFPRNVILGTTIETNNGSFMHMAHHYSSPAEFSKVSRYELISKAPHPVQRIIDLKVLVHPLKMLTYEPVLSFNLEPMLEYVETINPCMIWLGYDSKPKVNKLPEPPLWKFNALHWELSKRGYIVVLKTIRKAWWEK